MFDFGFWELFLCMAIALVVLGPERLPGVVRTLGHWAGRARVYVRTLSSELERQTQVGELRREVKATQESVRKDLRDTERDLTEMTADDDRGDRR